MHCCCFFISQEILKTLNHFTHKSANNLSFSSFFLKIILCYDIMKSIYCWQKKYNVTNFKKIKLYLYICFYLLTLFFMIPYPSLSSSQDVGFLEYLCIMFYIPITQTHSDCFRILMEISKFKEYYWKMNFDYNFTKSEI